jgi:hypothetical protein
VDGSTPPPQENTTEIASALTDGQPWYSRLIASISEAGNQ